MTMGRIGDDLMYQIRKAEEDKNEQLVFLLLELAQYRLFNAPTGPPDANA